MCAQVTPEYHAVISPALLACLRGRMGRGAAPPRQSRPTPVATPGILLRRDGQRPYRLAGSLLASGSGDIEPSPNGDLRRYVDLYLDTDRNLVAHVIVAPAEPDRGRPIYAVAPVQHEADAVDLVKGPLRPTGAAVTDRSTQTLSSLTEGDAHAISNAVA